MDYQKLQEQASELLKEGNYEALVKVYQDALKQGFPKRNEGEILSALAELYGHFGDSEKSIDHYSSAITIFRELEAEEGRQTYFPVIAAVANNLGILYESGNDNAAAAEKFKESLGLYEQLSEKKPDAYRPYVGTTMYNLGNLYGKKPDYYLSRKYFQQAYEVFKALAEIDPISFDAYVANTLVSLGNSYIAEHDYVNAEIYFYKAAPVYRKLADLNFDNFGAYLAATLNNLAVVSRHTKQQPKAVEYYQETLEIYAKLAESNPDAFLPYKAATFNSMGILFAEMFDKKEAEYRYNNAIEIYHELAQKHPDNFNPYVATSMHNLAILLDEQGRLEEAEKSYQWALRIREQLALKYPTAFDRDVCVTAMNLVTLYQQMLERNQQTGIREKAIALLEDVKPRLENYSTDEPVIQSLWSDHDYYSNFFNNVTTEALNVAKALREAGKLTEEVHGTIKPEEKLVFQKKIVGILQEQFDKYPQNEIIKPELATELGELAWLHIRLKDFDKARELADEGLKLTPDAYWVKMNFYYLSRLNKEKNSEQILEEILSTCSTDHEREKVRELIEKDLQKLKSDGLLKE